MERGKYRGREGKKPERRKGEKNLSGSMPLASGWKAVSGRRGDRTL